MGIEFVLLPKEITLFSNHVLCAFLVEHCFTTKRNYTVLKPQIHGAENTLFLQNRVISVDVSGKTAQIPIYHKGFFTFEKFGNTVFN